MININVNRFNRSQPTEICAVLGGFVRYGYVLARYYQLTVDGEANHMVRPTVLQFYRTGTALRRPPLDAEYRNTIVLP